MDVAPRREARPRFGRDVPLTREHVGQWLSEWEGDWQEEERDEIRTYLVKKISEYGIEDTRVDTTWHDNLPDEMQLIDMVMDDLDSYA